MKEQQVVLLNSVAVPVAVKSVVWLDVMLSGIISPGNLCLALDYCISFTDIFDKQQQCLAAGKYLHS